MVVALLILAACTAAPFTKRSQLILVSADEETQLGAQAYKEVLTKSRIDRSDTVVKPIEAVGRRLEQAADRPDYAWQFTVIDDPKQVNAFALPGGKVAVYTGLLPVAQTTSGLAVVLGHEIGHVVARHGAERISQGLVAQVGGSLLSAVVGGGPTANMILGAYGLGAQVGVLLPFSRTQESEADHIGLILMAKAGYDPRAAVAFWQRMEKQGGGGKTPEFLSTHPSHGTREQQVQAWMPEALRYYGTAPHAADDPLPGMAH
jgi:predicted Zn-dependent protease